VSINKLVQDLLIALILLTLVLAVVLSPQHGMQTCSPWLIHMHAVPCTCQFFMFSTKIHPGSQQLAHLLTVLVRTLCTRWMTCWHHAKIYQGGASTSISTHPSEMDASTLNCGSFVIKVHHLSYKSRWLCGLSCLTMIAFSAQHVATMVLSQGSAIA
jgi:hypothetical protein